MIGAVLAGGRGSRFGRASKPAALLAGRPLASYPVEALGAVCDRVAVVCKRGTKLPDLNGAERWDEPDEPRHPLAGIVHALAILRAAPPDGRLTDAVEQLMPARVAFPSRLVQSVNTPEELAEAERVLAAV